METVTTSVDFTREGSGSEVTGGRSRVCHSLIKNLNSRPRWSLMKGL